MRYVLSDAVYKVRPKSALIFLAGIATLLLAAHISVSLYFQGIQQTTAFPLYHLFALSREENIPTSFSALLWIISSLLLFIVWRAHKVGGRRQVMWILLSIILAFLAVDELAHLHERLARLIGDTWETSGPLYYAWVLPYGIGTGILALFVAPLLMKIDRKIRIWFIVAAVVFVGGSIGFEMIEGWYMDTSDGNGGRLNFYLVTAEEYLELIGLVLLVYASLLHIQFIGQNPPHSFDKQQP